MDAPSSIQWVSEHIDCRRLHLKADVQWEAVAAEESTGAEEARKV